MPRHAGKARTSAIDEDGIIDECLRMAQTTAQETIDILEKRFPQSLLIERMRLFQQECKTIVAKRTSR